MKRAFPTDPRDHRPLIVGVALVVLAAVAFALRIALTGFENPDYTGYLSPWYDHLARFGLAGFGEAFSNYNFPYLFLLYLSTLLPIQKIVAFKLIAITFDFVLAIVVYRIVDRLSGDRVRAALVGAGVLFLPTVFINSSLWGQSDVVYVSLTLVSLHLVLRDRIVPAWVAFGIAIAFKAQAMFFLPALVWVWMQKRGPWYAPLVALPVFVALSIPPALFGRPVRDTLSVYFRQYGSQPLLTASAPNVYTWVPPDLYRLLNTPALLFAVGAMGLLLTFCVLRVRYTPVNLLVVSAVFLLVAPFVLPQMHERYFYGFEIVVLILAALDPAKLWLVIASQFVAFFSYSSFLFDTNLVPWPVLSTVMLVLVAYVLHLLVDRADGRRARPSPEGERIPAAPPHPRP